MGDDRSRKPGTEVYAMAANATSAAKPIHKARSSAYVDVGSSFILILLLLLLAILLLLVVSVAAVAASTAARLDELDARCCSRSWTPTSHLRCHEGSTRSSVTCTFLISVDERSLALSFPTFTRVN